MVRAMQKSAKERKAMWNKVLEIIEGYKVGCQCLAVEVHHGFEHSESTGQEDYVRCMDHDLLSGVAYDSQNEFNPLALPGAGVRSSEQGSPEALNRAWCGRQGEGKAIWSQGLASTVLKLDNMWF